MAILKDITIIIDKDDSEQKGYEHACRVLQQAIPDLPLEQSRASFDLWSFGLYKYSLPLPEPIQCDLMKLYPQSFDNENRPFWFLLPRPPYFRDCLLEISLSPCRSPSTTASTTESLQI